MCKCKVLNWLAKKILSLDIQSMKYNPVSFFQISMKLFSSFNNSWNIIEVKPAVLNRITEMPKEDLTTKIKNLLDFLSQHHTQFMKRYQHIFQLKHFHTFNEGGDIDLLLGSDVISSHPKILLTIENGPKNYPESFEKWGQDGPKRPPKNVWPSLLLGLGCQEASKTAQGAPKTAQEAAKRAPKRPKMAPRRPQDAPRQS